MPVGEDTYPLTYFLHGQGRIARRATTREGDGGQQALYHQVTVVVEGR